MRDNVRNVSRGRAGRERWEFALDNRQVAAVAVGALVIVGSSFVLGLNTGKGIAARQADAKPAVANSLDAFDTAHENLPAPPEPKHWEYEKLGGTKPVDTVAPAAGQARVPPPARPLAARAGDATEAPPPQVSPAVATTGESVNPASVQPQAAPPAPAPAETARPAPAAPSAVEKAMAAVSGHAEKPLPPAGAVAKEAPAGGFVIQVGASPNRVEAERIAKKFASRGARVVAADIDGKRWYRVRLASMTYRERTDAERALARLARETGAHGFVTAAQ